MNINATLLGQMITFALLVWFTMKFVWPPLTRALEARRTRIADGLAAAERGAHELELAQKRAGEMLREARQQAADLVAQANKRAAEIIEEAKNEARAEGERLLTAARAEIDQEINRAKEQLRAEVVTIALAGASKILEREIDANAHRDILDKLVAEI
ncbi:MAG: F0F1 ATP synthase subunit B [Gammaproteobacteria bacterium]